MAKKTVEQLLQEKEQLEQRIKDERARQATLNRKNSNRKKMLAGIAVLEAVKDEQFYFSEQQIDEILDRYIQSPTDRAFLIKQKEFELSEKAAAEAEAEKKRLAAAEAEAKRLEKEQADQASIQPDSDPSFDEDLLAQ